MPTLEKPPSASDLSPAAVSAAINEFRHSRSGQLHDYIREVQEEKDAMVRYAQSIAYYESVRLIKALWMTEVVRAAAQSEVTISGEHRFSHILSSVEWQREAAQFLLENNERSNQDIEAQEKHLQPFWQAIWEIMGSAPDPKTRQEMLKLTAGFRQGITGPAATAYALRNDLQWDAYFPQHSVDDAQYGIDLLVTSGDDEGERPDHNYLVQIKTIKTEFPYFKLELIPPQANDPYLQRISRGSQKIINRDKLNPKYTEAVIATIGTEGVGRFSGLPTGAVSHEIGEQFKNLDNTLYGT